MMIPLPSVLFPNSSIRCSSLLICEVTLSKTLHPLTVLGVQFASKRHAKEAICKLALPRMLALDKQLTARKRKTIEDSKPTRTGPTAAVLNSENFVALLQGQ